MIGPAVTLKAIHVTVSRSNVHVVHSLHVQWLSRIIRILECPGRSRWRHLTRLRRWVHM